MVVVDRDARSYGTGERHVTVWRPTPAWHPLGSLSLCGYVLTWEVFDEPRHVLAKAR